MIALGAACGLWLSLGILGVIEPDTSSRAGVLAPAWTLIPIVALSLGVALRLRAPGSSPFLWLPAGLLFLPWLPCVVPAAFLLWVGPCAWPIWAALALAIGAAVVPHARFGGRWLDLCRHRRRAPLIAGGLAAALYLAAGWQVSAWLPEGDEPHYLVMADSLLRDGDLRIENNHRAHDYLRYVDRELKPDFLRRGTDGQIYSIHAPGLPVLLLPAYALFGYPGAVAWLALLSAAGSALAWRLCFTLTGQPGAAWFGWATAALPVPVLFHAFTIYPDGAGAVLVLTGAAALIDADRLRAPRAGLHGAALACLPWLHTRFVLLAIALGLCVLVRLAARPARPRAPAATGTVHASRVPAFAAFLAVPAVSAAAWLGFFYAIYGTPDPSAPYGTYTQSALAHVPVGLTGLLFDQQFGLIANAPVYLVSLCGLAWLAVRGDRVEERALEERALDGRVLDRGGRRLAIELLCVIVPYAIVAAMYRMWWGGWSAPARFLAPVLPLLALPAALVWARARTQTTRMSALAAVGVSVWLSLILLLAKRGRFAYNDRDGVALWTDWANPAVDLATGLPSLFQTSWAPALGRAAIWLGAFAATWAILRAIERARRRLPVAAVSIGYAAAVMVACSACWALAGVTGLRPEVSQVALLPPVHAGHRELAVVLEGVFEDGFEDGAHEGGLHERGAWLLRPSVMRASALPARLRLESATRRLPRERPLFFLPYVPAGRYRLDLAPSGPVTAPAHTLPPGGRLDVIVGSSGVPLRSLDLAAAGSDGLDLLLPIAVESLSIRADERARRAVGRIALVPQVAFDPRSGLAPSGNPLDRLPGAAALQTARYGDLTVYATSPPTSPSIYLESGGFWVRPRVEAVVLVESERPPAEMTVAMAVRLRNGPIENRVRLAVEGWQREVTLPAGGELLVDVPVSRRGATALRLFAAEGVRPSALDPTSGDHRRLGIWVEFPGRRH